ncbi:MAG TPA: XdhC/CoxI family protein [Thermoleophilaceae bacterium]|nr:XdhC/CoxI family protein [Thermoleophilaceae bacterium]
MSLQSEFARLSREGGRAALVTVVQADDGGAAVGARILLPADGEPQGTLGSSELDDAARRHADELMWGSERSELREEDGVGLFVDVVAPAPRIVIFGAVDFAAALCRTARVTGWRPYVVDPRSRFATPDRFPEAEEVIAGWPADAIAHLGGIDRATYLVVLTHDPKLDDAALTVALDSEAPYIGAMGSRRAQAKRRERLLAAGIAEEQLERISAPVGLDIGALGSEETGLSIMAEVVAVRNGRQGGRLASASGRIHEAV